MAKRKAGLHKELSLILNGVSIPEENGTRRSSQTPPPGPTDYVPPKPLTPGPKIPLAPKPQQPVQTPPTPKSQQLVQTTTTPKPPSPAWSLPKAIPPKAVERLRLQQAKGVGFVKIFRQIPWQIFHSRAARL